MLLAIDAGNTRTKLAVFDAAGDVLWQEILPNHLVANLFLPFHLKVDRVVIANVAGKAHGDAIQKVLAEHGIGHVSWAKSTGLASQVKNNYTQPALLGIDRWAAAIATWHFHKQACLVVNAGTAVTIDVVQPSALDCEEAEFSGGVILPGLNLMQAALAQNTAALKVGEGHYASYPTNTADAIYTGACDAIIGAVALMYDRVSLQHEDTLIVLSGGDAAVLCDFLERLKMKVVVMTNLVLQGLRLMEKDS